MGIVDKGRARPPGATGICAWTGTYLVGLGEAQVDGVRSMKPRGACLPPCAVLAAARAEGD